MAAWIKACLSLELIYSDRLTSSQLGSTENNVGNQPPTLPDTTQEEVADLLTNILFWLIEKFIAQLMGNDMVGTNEGNLDNDDLLLKK